MKPGGWRAGAEERQSIAGLHNGRMAGMRIDSCASSGPKKPQCDSNVYWGWGGTEGPDRLNVGWGPHVFWGGGSGRDPALDLYKPQTSTSRVSVLFRALPHHYCGGSAVNIFQYGLDSD
jgi:hypothetical protein